MQNLDELIKSSRSLGKFFKGASALVELADSIEADKHAHEALKKSLAGLQDELAVQSAKVLAAKAAAESATQDCKEKILAAQDHLAQERERIDRSAEAYKQAKADEVAKAIQDLAAEQAVAEKELALVLADVEKAKADRDKLNEEINSIVAKLRGR